MKSQPKRMAKETTTMKYEHFDHPMYMSICVQGGPILCGGTPGPTRIGVGQCTWNVSDVRYRNPLSWLGRLLGGCAVCGRLEGSVANGVVIAPPKGTHQDWVCIHCLRFVPGAYNYLTKERTPYE